jgi:DNA ligase-1
MSTHRWPPLFKRSTSGKISTWQIWVVDAAIFTRSGYVGMKMKETKDIIKAGKNIGKKNETTPHDQAILEAQAKVDKQLDRGYVWDAGDAASGKVDDCVEGAFYPMLAKSFDDHGSKINFPCFVQPKLDGLRATCIGGQFFSRSRKPFNVLKHLTDEIVRLGLDEVQLDGELYNHDYRDEFETIVGAIKRDKPSEQSALIQYHIYDAKILGDYRDRKEYLDYLRERCADSKHLVFVETRIVKTLSEARVSYEDFMEQGYEGAMLRNLLGEYEDNKRSSNLQKLKEFQDSEFEIVDVLEGRGALQGCVGKFVCRIDDQHGERNFKSVLSGKNVREFLKKAFEDRSLWEGKWMTVQHQGWTRKDRKPRFPVGLRLRDAE